MRIKKVTVKKLFGMFDHEIPMTHNDRITIIHAPNGYGKTTILEIINSILKRDFVELKKVSFQKVKIDFDNETFLSITKENADNQEKDKYDLISYSINDNNINKSHTIEFPVNEEYFYNLAHEAPYIRRLGRNTWIDKRKGKKVKYNELVKILKNKESIHLKDNKKTPKWVLNFLNKLNETSVILVQAQRLLQINSTNNSPVHLRNDKYSSKQDTTPSVLVYSKELKKNIESKLAESASLSQELDRTFPSRLVEKMMRLNQDNILPQESIKKELKELERKRSRLEEVGLLYKGAPSTLLNEEEINQIDKHTRSVLSLYIKDTKEKLKIFDDLEQKINLMKSIIKDRFKYKKMEINREKGIIFKTNDNRILSPEKLSSGEQHELILIYELLFRSNPGSLILIDEPEISLHVGWQQQFLNDLLQISKLTKIDILIATHSPQIIHDRWDLTVGLGSDER